jgi:hypothetical protein
MLQARWLVLLVALLGILATPANPAVAEPMGAPADAQLHSALDLLSTSPADGELRDVLIQHDIGVRYVPMSPGVYARYSVGRRVIEIDSRWQDADPVTLAAVISHEATHAQDAVSGYLTTGGASACIDSEVRAFRNAALFWTEQYGPKGKPAPADDLEQQLNLIAQRERTDPAGLEQLVRQAYTDQCRG